MPLLPRYWPILTLLLGLRLIFWLGAFPNPDEAYYWLWGQHLDWSYFDHPPFHAWMQGAFTAVLGQLRPLYWEVKKPQYRLRKHGEVRNGRDAGEEAGAARTADAGNAGMDAGRNSAHSG